MLRELIVCEMCGMKDYMWLHCSFEKISLHITNSSVVKVNAFVSFM